LVVTFLDDKDMIIELLKAQVKLLSEQLQSQSEQLESQSKQLEQLNETIDRLNETIANLQRRFFGSKSEQTKYLDESIRDLFNFLLIDAGLMEDKAIIEEEPIIEPETETITYQRNKRTKPAYFSDGIPVEKVYHKPEQEMCECCDSPLSQIGEGELLRTEVRIIPKSVTKVEHYVVACECKSCKANSERNNFIAKGSLPANPISGAPTASASLLADIVYQKFTLFLPLYRQKQDYARYGLFIDDKNMANWLITVVNRYLQPLYNRMKDIAFNERTIIAMDETPYQIIIRSDGKSGQSDSYYWVIQTQSSEGEVITIFDSRLGRNKETLKDIIQDYQGYLISDGYSTYNDIKGIFFASCLAHKRRKFVECKSKKAAEAIVLFNKIFAIERELANVTPSQRFLRRIKEVKPVLDQLYEWLETTHANPKSRLGEAIKYCLKLKEKQYLFLSNANIPVSNNSCENAIRPSAIGRKNWLFSTSEAGANANGVYLSLVETAKSSGINIYKYFLKLFEELPKLGLIDQENIDEYLPWSKNILETCK